MYISVRLQRIALTVSLIFSLLLPASAASAKPPSAVQTVVPSSAFYTENSFDSSGAYHQRLYIVQGVPADSGVKIAWSGDKKSVTLSKGNTAIKLTAGQQTAYVNGKPLKLEEKVRFEDGAMVAPSGLLAKKLGLNLKNAYNYSTYQKFKKRAEEEAARIAQYVTRDGLTISSEKTVENVLDLWGNVKSDAPVLIEIVKDGELPRYKIAVPDQGQLDELLYLSDGPGTYSISLYDRMTKQPLTDHAKNLFTVVKSPSKTDKSDYTYLLPERYIESDNPEIKALAKQITEGLTGDMAKTQAIHDWVARNIVYDTEEYFTGKIGNHSAVDILHRKKAVCDGYSKITAALNRAVGIKTKVVWGLVDVDNWEPVSYVAGTNYNHAWVETFIDGKWIPQDTTWDAGYVADDDFTSEVGHKYFNPAPEQFMKDHLAAFVVRN